MNERVTKEIIQQKEKIVERRNIRIKKANNGIKKERKKQL